MIHPLLNKDSKHYDTDDKPSIYYMEENLSLIEMIGFCSGNIFKYESRLGKKGNDDADRKKIQTYRDYRELLMKYLDIRTQALPVRYIFDKFEDIEYKI